MGRAQIGNLQALAQFLSNASKSVSGTLADILSPARMIIFGTLLTTLNKPMFAVTGAVYASFGTVITLYWVTAGARSLFWHACAGLKQPDNEALLSAPCSPSTGSSPVCAACSGMPVLKSRSLPSNTALNPTNTTLVPLINPHNQAAHPS